MQKLPVYDSPERLIKELESNRWFRDNPKGFHAAISNFVILFTATSAPMSVNALSALSECYVEAGLPGKSDEIRGWIVGAPHNLNKKQVDAFLRVAAKKLSHKFRNLRSSGIELKCPARSLDLDGFGV